MSDKSKKVKAKKGKVIDRKYNRTVDTSRAMGEPKWEYLLDTNGNIIPNVRRLKANRGTMTIFDGGRKSLSHKRAKGLLE
jgi:hypothetical protein